MLTEKLALILKSSYICAMVLDSVSWSFAHHGCGSFIFDFLCKFILYRDDVTRR